MTVEYTYPRKSRTTLSERKSRQSINTQVNACKMISDKIYNSKHYDSAEILCQKL